MRTIGKIAALAMTVSLALVLTACGGSASSSAASTSASASAASASASAASESASASAASASAASESASASAASASAESASTTAADANVYTNEYFALKYNLPEGWSFVDTSALKNANGVVAAASENAEIDMVAMDANQSQLVVVAVESPDSKTAGMTPEKYLEAQEELIKAGLGGNYSYNSTTAEVTFNGIDRTLPALLMNIDANGAKLAICQTVAEKDGAFFNAIAIGASEEEVTKALEGFAAVTA